MHARTRVMTDIAKVGAAYATDGVLMLDMWPSSGDKFPIT